MKLRIGVAFLALLSLSQQAWSQALADRVPESAQIYVGWCGTDNLGANYAGSHAEAIMKQSSMGKLLDEVVPQLPGLLMDKRDAVSIESATRAISLGKLILHKPCAFWAKLPVNNQAAPQWAILVKAGADAAKLMDTAQRTLESAGADKQITLQQKDDIVILAGGMESGDSALVEAADSLSTSDSFKASLAKVVKEPCLTVFANIAEARVRAQMLASDKTPPDQIKVVDDLLESLGINGMKSFTLASGFSGKDWHTDAVLLAPDPRKGLATLMENKPFSEDLLKRIPDTATSVKAVRFDIVKFIKTTQASIVQAVPAAQQPIEQAFAGAKLSVGKDLINDIFEPMGDEWVLYNASDVGGDGIIGSVLMNKPDNAFKLKQGLNSLSIAISNLAPLALPQDFKFSGRTIKAGDASIYYFALPGVAPAWSINDGILYLGLHPQTVISAIQRQGKSILEKPDFTEAMTRLERKDIAGFGYTDINARISAPYELLLVGTRIGVGMLESKGATIPEPVIPPLSALKHESSASVSVIWADKDGWNYHSVSPYPLADLLCSPLTQIEAIAPMTAITLPALEKARHSANEVKGMSNLRQIGVACFMYANENKGAFPDTLDELAKDFLTDATVFRSVVGQNDAYVYLGNSKVKMPKLADPSATPLAYDPAVGETHFAVLFCDGHVEMIESTKKDDILKAAKDAGMNVP